MTSTTTNTATIVPQSDMNLEQINTDNDSLSNNMGHLNFGILDKIITNPNLNQNQSVSNSGAINFSQSSEQTISNISDLQTVEMKLYESLDNKKLTQEARSRIIDKINEIAQTRMNLYQGISNMASSYQQNLATSNNTLQEQMLAIDIVENELNVAKRRLNLLEDEKYNKLRLVEINTYYGKQYNAYKDVAKNIVYICILVLIIVILGIQGILPPNIYITLNGLVIVVGVVIIGKQIIKLSNKDNMNFDEYDWYFNKSKAPVDTTGSLTGTGSSSSNPWDTPSLACVGATCCNQADGFMYDSTQNMCVLSTGTTTTGTTTTGTTTTSTTTN
jgi:hypothetical protein